MMDISDTLCPQCGVAALRIEWRLRAKEIGSFSLSGAQMKFSAREVPWLICDNCHAEVEGEVADG